MTLRKRFYVFGSIAAGLLLLVFLVQAGLQYYLKPRLGHLLQKVIVTGSDSLYRFEQGKFSVNLWKGGVALDSCILTLDSTRFAARKASGQLPNLTVSLRLERVEVS